LAEFLAAPIDEVRKVAPKTMILGAGGTRRKAVLSGFSSQGSMVCNIWLQLYP
jgi:hypothetical protein